MLQGVLGSVTKPKRLWQNIVEKADDSVLRACISMTVVMACRQLTPFPLYQEIGISETLHTPAHANSAS